VQGLAGHEVAFRRGQNDRRPHRIFGLLGSLKETLFHHPAINIGDHHTSP
jgi:hypothetical protein